MLVNDIEMFQKMKSKVWLSIEKVFLKYKQKRLPQYKMFLNFSLFVLYWFVKQKFLNFLFHGLVLETPKISK